MQSAHLAADLETAQAELVRLEADLQSVKAELEEKYRAEFDAAMEEGMREVTADYKAQLPGIRDRACELGWKEALRKVGVLGDIPVFRNPPKFPSSDSDLLSIIDSPLVPGPSSQAPPAASAAPDTTSEAPPAASATLEAASKAPPAASATPEACPVNSDTTSAGPEAGAAEPEVPPEIDCNVDAAAL
ncbi:hypothetical protein AAC387_Pa12g0502 [Persea americana]